MSLVESLPRRTGLPREVFRWLQSLDLSVQFRNARRDLSNGLVLAEIFSWYYPGDLLMHSFQPGESLASKLANWSLLHRFFAKRGLAFSKELTDGTLHRKPGAAEQLLQRVYSTLTNRRVKSINGGEGALSEEGAVGSTGTAQEPNSEAPRFTDARYQRALPMHARSTASQALKSNVRLTQLLAEPSEAATRQRAEVVLREHLAQRRREREQDPCRFDVRPTLGELAVRLPPLSAERPRDTGSGVSLTSSVNDSRRDTGNRQGPRAAVQLRGAVGSGGSSREIHVRQSSGFSAALHSTTASVVSSH
ncbi:spermatogenesis-associated protein 4 isoform X2 [Lethenteron reissneri]|uniref:spermatogenesis-associated protein 4 isoform X2 n=1 Tax=Lethenteron reissneri TaxID=7753 RepID=UPI002AB5F500|nr:spermatogenesis-associated protein 4 isoform X2 [Lethenteron reissneri]